MNNKKKNLKISLIFVALILTIGGSNSLLAHANGHDGIEFEELFTIKTLTIADLWDYTNDSLLMLEDSIKRKNTKEVTTYLNEIKDTLEELEMRTNTNLKN